jgi:hypothetical protein
VPRAGNALELVLTTIDETEPRAGDDILDGLRDEHLAGVSERGDASTGDH